jgi:hypothetical protein
MNFSMQVGEVYRVRCAADFEYWYYIQYLPAAARSRPEWHQNGMTPFNGMKPFRWAGALKSNRTPA